MKMSAGKLKHRVKIRLHLDVPNASQGLDETYSAGLDRWADIEQIGSAAYYGSKQVGEEVTHWIVVRKGAGTRPEDLTTDWVVEHGGRRYRIKRSRLHPKSDQFTAIEALDLGAI